MRRARRTFSQEFKTEAALLVINSGRTIADVAREIDVREQVLGRWVRAYKQEHGLATEVKPGFQAPKAQAVTESMEGASPYEGPKLRDEIKKALDAMTDVQDSDGGLQALALRYADRIDAGLAAGGKDSIKVMYLGPHLFNVLRELGGSPTVRRTAATAGPAPASEKPKKSRLSKPPVPPLAPWPSQRRSPASWRCLVWRRSCSAPSRDWPQETAVTNRRTRCRTQ